MFLRVSTGTSAPPLESRLVARRLIASFGLAASLVSALGCEGSVTSNTPQIDGSPNAGSGAAPPPLDVAPAPSGRVARLTHEQWENAVRDLLLLPDRPGLSSTFPADARTAGFLFDNHELSLDIDQVLWSAYASAAETLAAQVTRDAQALARLLPAAAGNDRDRARAFVTRFGERAFRRPLSDGEIGAFVELYDQGTSLYDDQTGFAAGIRLVLEAFLQSPHFLYRVESSTRPSGETIPLSGWEVAQRLSFLLTNSTPDDELLAAARGGQLDTPGAVREQALRLLSKPTARPAIVGFHQQLLEFEKFENINPSPRFYPDISARFGEDVLASSRYFVEDLAFERNGTFEDLMTSRRAFVNDELARVYGVSGSFDERFVPVELPENERRGIFTQLGFLAANSTSVHPDPIHRGVFIATRVLCLGIAAPPDGVPPLPPIANGTNRQVVERHTQSTPVCRSCHENLINPFGFTFENYDATGAYRTLDNGLPVDASATPFIDGERVAVQNSIELAEALASSPSAHECFVSHLLEYAFGRRRSDLDDALVQALTDASMEGTPILELLVQLAQSTAFLTRSTEELP